MTEPTLAELTGIVLRLATNYARSFDDDEQLMGLVADWAEQLDGYDVRDIELARVGLMADPNVRYMPPISDFRRRVQLARMDRKREDGEGEGCPSCVGSGGTVGWRHEGTDGDGYEFVDYCPNGCKPPSPHRRPAATVGRRRRAFIDAQAQELPVDAPHVAAARAAMATTVVQTLDDEF